MSHGQPEIPDSSSSMRVTIKEKIKRLQGPILVLGGSGFIGGSLVRLLCAHRADVCGVATRLPAWRLDGLAPSCIFVADLLVDSNLDQILDTFKPRTVFDCISYGGYSFETDGHLIYQTNFGFATRLLPRLAASQVAVYVHAGSSSEYGDNASGPLESGLIAPNSDYAVSKAAASNLIYYYGKKKSFPCANLRLYSVYGPLEDSSRLIPNVIREGLNESYPEFVHPDISRDFVYIDDACTAFIDTALNLREVNYGESFNVGTGQKTTIREVAKMAQELFSIQTEPSFKMASRSWDLPDWYANVQKVEQHIGWRPHTSFREGFQKTIDWYQALPNKQLYYRASKRFGLDTKHGVSAIVACYKDGEAIPIMYERLKNTFAKLNIDYEIIFVNDCSPDTSEEIIRGISRNDRRVFGISHSRNFGSQAAFRSGMEVATKNAAVLLDGDLQDPPELIERFVDLWRQGYDVVYGRRTKREGPVIMQLCYKLFYRIFDAFSYLRMPHDAGDFSLMDKRVVQAVLQFPERDLFLRGVRAYVGFKQTGVDYIRPKRPYGHSTNSFLRNLGWAKKGILSFSNVPLNILSFGGVLLFGISVFLALLQILFRILFPHLSASGITTVLLIVLFFGSVNLFAVSIIVEYISKIFEETKQRPHYIRRSIIRDGEVRMARETDARGHA